LNRLPKQHHVEFQRLKVEAAESPAFFASFAQFASGPSGIRSMPPGGHPAPLTSKINGRRPRPVMHRRFSEDALQQVDDIHAGGRRNGLNAGVSCVPQGPRFVHGIRDHLNGAPEPTRSAPGIPPIDQPARRLPSPLPLADSRSSPSQLQAGGPRQTREPPQRLFAPATNPIQRNSFNRFDRRGAGPRPLIASNVAAFSDG